MLVLLKNLSDHFDSLQKGRRLPEGERDRENLRLSPALRSPGLHGDAAPGTQQDKKQGRERRPRSSTRRQRHSSSSDSTPDSRSRSRSPKEKSTHRKGKQSPISPVCTRIERRQRQRQTELGMSKNRYVISGV